MIKDLDKEMEKRNLDGIIVSGKSSFASPEFLYVTRCTLPRGGMYIKKVNGEEVLIVSNIDLENAKEGRVKNVKTFQDLGYYELLKKYGKNTNIIFYEKVLKELGIEGKIGIYGEVNAPRFLKFVRELENRGYSIHHESSPTLFDILRKTKDEYEIKEIKKAGKITKKVFGNLIEFLSGCKIKNGKLIYKSKHLTARRLKSIIKQFSQEKLPEISYPEDMLVAVGKKAFNPHYLGKEEEIVVNKPIVIDLFPRVKSGYWFDVTRTFVIGKASKQVKKLYEEVREAQQIAFDLIEEGISAKEVEEKVIEFFRKRGHEIYSKEGYLHSLGHGIGLTLSDLPNISIYSEDMIENGNVFTVEPGLYYKRIGGIRIEDVVLVKKGKPKILSSLNNEFEI